MIMMTFQRTRVNFIRQDCVTIGTVIQNLFFLIGTNSLSSLSSFETFKSLTFILRLNVHLFGNLT